MNAVWMVRSRQLAARFRFWLAIFGYNPRDRSLSHKLYLVYAAVFYCLWGFAVLSFFAGGVARLLEALRVPSHTASLADIAIALGMSGLLVWWISALFAASRRSPFIFSEDDAYLICQTPANRSAVAVAWLVGQWPASAIPVAAVAVTLGFALVEGASNGMLDANDIPRYLLAGARSLVTTIPLQFGSLSLAAALGALRLRGDRSIRYLSTVPLALILFFLFTVLVTQGGREITARVNQTALLQPLAIPIAAGFGAQPFIIGFLIALGWTMIGLASLWVASWKLNLGRAAQESQAAARMFTALQVGSFRDVQEYQLQNRLGTDRRPGMWLQPVTWLARVPVLVRKDRLQAGRSRRVSTLLPWLAIFGIGIAIVLLPIIQGWDLGALALAVVYWAMLIMQRSIHRLQDDLAHWSIFRQLPIEKGKIIFHEILPTLAIASLVSWSSLLTGQFLLSFLQVGVTSEGLRLILLAFLAPLAAGVAALAGCLDMLRQSKSAFLLAGRPPQPSYLGLGLVAAPVLVAASGFLLLPVSAVAYLVAWVVCAGCFWLYWHLAARQFARIQ